MYHRIMVTKDGRLVYLKEFDSVRELDKEKIKEEYKERFKTEEVEVT